MDLTRAVTSNDKQLSEIYHIDEKRVCNIKQITEFYKNLDNLEQNNT